MWCSTRTSRQGGALQPDSLALQQHVGLSEQRHLWSQAPLTVGQVADVTPQLLLALSAGLQLRFQPPQFLLQPKSGRKNKQTKKKHQKTRVLKEVVAATRTGFGTEHWRT